MPTITACPYQPSRSQDDSKTTHPVHSLGAAVPLGILPDPRREPRRKTDTATTASPARACLQCRWTLR